jgi:hypothetical protein
MKKVVLLALLALALPIAASANTFDYAGVAGVGGAPAATVNGSVTNNGSVSITLYSLSVNGGSFAAGTISISVNLGSTSCGPGCLNITSGTVKIWNASSTLLFSGNFSSGSATQVGNGAQGTVINLQGITTGGTTIAGVFNLGRAGWGGSSDTFVTPEPGTLGLLGTGLVGLAGIVRRKLRG